MRAALGLIVALSAGCSSMEPVPYAPDPAVMRAVPRAKAREMVRKQLEQASPWQQYRTTPKDGIGTGVRAVEVDDEVIRFEVLVGAAAGTPYGFDVASLDPRIYVLDNDFGVCLTGPFDGSTSDAKAFAFSKRVLWFDTRRDAELLVDAIVALKAAGTR